MATKQWTGSGDWFSTSWQDTAPPGPSGPPQPGDIAYDFGGTLTITTADAAPTLDGIAFHFASASADMVPTLDVANVNFGIGIVIDNLVNGHAALLTTRGTVALAGTLAANAAGGGVLTLDIEAVAGLATFANAGTIEAENTGSLSVIGTIGATLENSGVLLANNGSAGIATALVSTGTIGATGTGTLVLAGGVDNRGTMYAAAALGGTLFSAGKILIGGTLANSGAISVVDFGTLAATGGVANTGTIVGGGGSLVLGGGVTNSGAIVEAGAATTLAGGLANNGFIIDQSGTVTIAGTVSGTGTISVAGEVDIAGAVDTSQVIAFASDDAMLRLADAGGFDGRITGMTGHDLIDLQGIVADSTTYDGGTGTIAVFDGATEVARFRVAGPTGALGVASDNAGGTILTLEQGGTRAQVAQYMIANSADNVGPHHWSPAVVTYTFDAAADWSATEQAAFQNAMALWSAVADVTFQPVSVGASLDISRASDGQANTLSNFINGINTTATLAIDTSAPSWRDLSSLGTDDASGLGGYGFQTVLHELGHVLGLNHPGPYNESAAIGQQLFYTDTRQYTVMSYFNADESGGDWRAGTTDISAQTPMLFDIDAVQQIYGANTTDLAGGDTFGFHSTFGSASLHPLRQYDFSQDTTPVVTLYDGGPNNTLDLSGFAGASTVDLAPGAFSSVDAMTDNIAIAYGTTIDSALGGAGDDVFRTNGGNDTIDGGGGANTVEFGGAFAQYALVQNGDSMTVSGLGATDLLHHVAMLAFADRNVAVDVSCFVAGTRIATPRGAVAVEELAIGDHVLTRDGRAAPVRWLGRREVDVARHPHPRDVRPVRIRAGAIAPGLPERDLLVSPDHALALDGALVPARYLLNGATILADSAAANVLYLHVELDRHDVLLAEGLPAESYLDTGNRDSFAGAPITRLHARFAPDPAAALRTWHDRACAPLLIAGAALTLLRGRLLWRAEALGHVRTEDPRLRLFADGGALVTRRRADWLTARLPHGITEVRLSSRAWVPLHMLADPAGDARRLGVAVAGVLLDGEPVPLDDPRLAAGWHAPEPDGRWTDGAATIATGGAATIGLRLAPGGIYWRGGAARRIARA